MSSDGKKSTENISEGCGCLFIIYTIISVIIGILFVVWLIQGRPDTWYGKLFSLQIKAIVWIVVLLAAVGVLYFIIRGITVLIGKFRR